MIGQLDTKPKEQKVTPNETIANMVRSINGGNQEAFYNAAKKYADTLSPGGNAKYLLNRVITEKPVFLHELKELPHKIKGLIELSFATDVKLFLNEKTKEFYDSILLEWKCADLFKKHNLTVRNKILLHGMTGNGKTTFVRSLAEKAGLQLYEVQHGAMIDSHMGNSGGNIENVFKQVNGPCILFFDEIDTIGTKRSSGQAVDGEMNRVLNVLLINMEKMHPETIFIGATNRFDILDPAFVRRFHSVYEMPIPDEQEKRSYVNFLCDRHNVKELSTRETENFLQ